MLERFSVRPVLQVHVPARQRLQAADGHPGAGDPRILSQFHRFDLLLVRRQMRRRRDGLDDLRIAQHLHAALEAHPFVPSREDHAPRCHVGRAAALGILRDVHNRLIQNRQHVVVLVPRHAGARRRRPAVGVLDRARCADEPVGVVVRGVLGPGRHPVGSHELDVAVQLNGRIAARGAAFLPRHREGASAALVGYNRDPQHLGRAIRVRQLLLVFDADIFARQLEALHLAAAALHDGPGIAPHDHDRRDGCPALVPLGHVGRERDREDRHDHPRVPAPATHRNANLRV